MTLKQPFKLNDIQNRPLVVLCAFLIIGIIYINSRADSREAILQAELRATYRERDSINNDRIRFYEGWVFEKNRNTEILTNTDSLLRAKTQKSTEIILNNAQ